MKNPLFLLVPMILVAGAASARAEGCSLNWGKLRRSDPEQLAKLKPVAVSSCSDVEKLGEKQDLFWRVRLAMIALPAQKNGSETVKAADLPAVLRDAVLGPDKSQFFSAGERLRLNAILAGADLCNAAVGDC